MKYQVSLLLVCMLFSKALSLTCHQCLPTLTRPCTNIGITTCSDQCLTTTMSTTIGDTNADVILKTCGSEELCQIGSLNVGLVKINSNAKCCNTTNCNSETMPAPAKQVFNGRMCYVCNNTDCSGIKPIVNCEGSEDRCVSASVQQGNDTLIMKGCTSKNFCNASESLSIPGFPVAKVKCCEGNLCNGAESFTLSFLLMMVPLLSSFLVY